MTRFAPYVVAVCFSFVMAAPSFAGKYNKTLSIGDAAPEWKELKDADGKSYSSADWKDKEVIVVAFSCNTCPTAVDYENRLITLGRKFAEDKRCGPGTIDLIQGLCLFVQHRGIDAHAGVAQGPVALRDGAMFPPLDPFPRTRRALSPDPRKLFDGVDQLNPQDPDRITGAEDCADIMRIMDILHHHCEVLLPVRENLPDLRDAPFAPDHACPLPG